MDDILTSALDESENNVSSNHNHHSHVSSVNMEISYCDTTCSEDDENKNNTIQTDNGNEDETELMAELQIDIPLPTNLFQNKKDATKPNLGLPQEIKKVLSEFDHYDSVSRELELTLDEVNKKLDEKNEEILKLQCEAADLLRDIRRYNSECLFERGLHANPSDAIIINSAVNIVKTYQSLFKLFWSDHSTPTNLKGCVVNKRTSFIQSFSFELNDEESASRALWTILGKASLDNEVQVFPPDRS